IDPFAAVEAREHAFRSATEGSASLHSKLSTSSEEPPSRGSADPAPVATRVRADSTPGELRVGSDRRSTRPPQHSDEATAAIAPRVARMLGALLAIGLAFPLLVFASTGTFARYVADDYCWAGLLRTDGFVNSQIAWYTAYSPRYAFTFLVNLVELAGP